MRRRCAGASLLALALAGCGDDAMPPPPVDLAGADLAHPPVSKVDVLFLVDNSVGMDANIYQFKAAIPSLLAVFDGLSQQGTKLDLHFGVVTSDYGAGNGNAPGCTPSPGGQGGRLQPIGAAASPSCLPPVGTPFVALDYGAMTSNLPPGQDLATTLQCMSSVASPTSCGFQHQLESVHAALSGGVAENAGFLRDDALLAVLLLTDEDDCSAPPVTDLFDKSKIAEYGYEDSYRCTRFGILCGNPPAPPPYGAPLKILQGCTSAPNPGADPNNAGQGPGKLYDVQRYIDLFTQPRASGGLKDFPGEVLLAAIDGPPKPFAVVLSDPATPAGQPYASCPMLDEQSIPACVQVLEHSCQNAQMPIFSADPAVRINQVLAATGGRRLGSICEFDFRAALDGFGQAIAARL